MMIATAATGKLFQTWPDMCIRLDIWHFMRRFTAGCSTDAHQLYGVFMRRLSACIFEWSSEDLQLLREAKRSELLQRNLAHQSDEDLVRWLTKKELSLHCRRQTRGTEETTRLIGDLLGALLGDQGLDTLGVPLFDVEKMKHIWETQKRHVSCIQDPDGVSLYTCTGKIKKGLVQLPTYRCARGSTSLESFHNHMAKFIPGTSASDMHFQAYLLEGLRRWNEDRSRQMSDMPLVSSSYSSLLHHAVNDLGQKVIGRKVVLDYRPPRKYTGEKIGVEYLFTQTNKVLQAYDPEKENLDWSESGDTDEGSDDNDDEGFEEEVEEDPTQPPVEVEEMCPRLPKKRKQASTSVPTAETPTPLPPSPIGDTPPACTDTSDALGPDNVGGYGQVNKLAEYLFSLRGQQTPITNDQATHIIRLWEDLSDFDKQPTVPRPRHATRLTKCSVTTFKARAKTTCVAGIDTVRRTFHGSEGGVAQRPDSNRYMELLFIKLATSSASLSKQRWNLVIGAYSNIRELVSNNPGVMAGTGITLYNVNSTTLKTWHNARMREKERQFLEQNVRLQEPQMASTRQLPAAQAQISLSQMAPIPPLEQHQFQLQSITVGLGPTRRRVIPPSASPANPDSTYRHMTPVPRTPKAARPILPKPPSTEEPASPGQAKSTKWYRKQREKKKMAGEYVKEYTRHRTDFTYKCKKCGLSRTKETKHKQYCGHWYCPTTATETYEEWRSSREKCRLEQKHQKLQQQQQQQQQQQEHS